MKNIKTLFIAMVLINSNYALAEDNTGTIQFIGSITNTTCSFHAQQNGASGNTVKLGGHTLSDINGAGVPEQNFYLIATNDQGLPCTVAEENASVAWVPNNGVWGGLNYLPNDTGTGSAQNVGIQLLDKDGTVIGETNSTVRYTGLTTDLQKTKLAFKAKIIKTSDSIDATAGSVTGEAVFAVSYN